MENIKDFLLLDIDNVVNEEEKEKKVRVKNRAEYETVFVSGPDFGIRRKTKNTSKVFVCIISAGQIYFKDEKTGEIDKDFTPNTFGKFFSDLPDEGYEFVGSVPSWFNRINKGVKFATNFIAICSDRILSHFISRNMIYISDVGDFLNGRMPSEYSYTMHGAIDVTSSELVFRILTEVAEQEDVKRSFALSLVDHCESRHRNYYDETDKIRSVFPICYIIQVYNMYAEGDNKYEDINFCNYLKDMYGVDGVRKLIHSFMESPMNIFPRVSDFHDLLCGKFNNQIRRPVKFELNKLISYTFYESYRQGFNSDTGYNGFFSNWKDDLNLQYVVYGEIKDKYPDYLLSHHQLLSTKANTINQIIDDAKWKEQVEKMQKFEYENSEFRIICPKTTNDMVNEARMQSNCLSGYIKSVTNGSCMIFFLRRKKQLENSYVTIEIRSDMSLGQVKAKFNKEPDGHAMNFVRNWHNKVVLADSDDVATEIA